MSVRAVLNGFEEIYTCCDCAASGDANNTNHSLSSSADCTDAHKCGFAESADSSRNTANARIRYYGLANRCRPRCNAGASCPSAACEYDMNAS